MQDNIGGDKVREWVKDILSHNRKVTMIGRQNGFTDNLSYPARRSTGTEISKSMPSPSSMGQSFGTERSVGPEPLVNDLNDIDQRKRPPQMPQDQMVFRKEIAGGEEHREMEAAVNEQVVQRAASDDVNAGPRPQINLEEVADKVYRLMQNDLILERERATRIGG